MEKKKLKIISPSYKLHVQMHFFKNITSLLFYGLKLHSFVEVTALLLKMCHIMMFVFTWNVKLWQHNFIQLSSCTYRVLTTLSVTTQHVVADATCRIANDGYNHNFACCRPVSAFPLFNPLQTKRKLLYLKTQSVPRCKHFSSRL
jgi:hypothetical protein